MEAFIGVSAGVVASSATRRRGGYTGSMYYTYVLLSSKNKRLYVGYTDNLKRRLTEHNSKNGGTYSKKNAPFILVFYEAFLSKKDASKQEMFYKSGYGREILHDKISQSLKSLRD